METTTVIPKDKLKSCQPWQLETLDLPEPDSNMAYSSQSASTEEQHSDNPDDNNNAEKEIAATFQQAREDGQRQGHDEGFNKGYQEGHSKGYQEGHNQGYQDGQKQGESEIMAELDQVSAVFSNLDQQLQTLDQDVAQNLLALAIDLTKKMTAQVLTFHPELILPVVQDAVRQLPGTPHHLRLYLHAEDARIVRQHLNEQLTKGNWEICEDNQMTPGGCRIEAGGSEIDASMETRWRRTLAAIGQKNDWIEK